MPRCWFRHAFIIVAVVLLVLPGCSGSSAEGTVSLDGQPVDGGVILFAPSSDPQGKRVSADIVGGKYTARGLAPGSYRVEIT